MMRVKLKNIENVFFDLDDTLWACSQNAKNTLEEVYNLYHLDKYFDSFNHYFTLYSGENERLWGEYGKGHLTKEELNDLRFAYPLLRVGIKQEDLVEQYRSSFFQRIKHQKLLMPGAKEILDYLSPKYNLYILSNGFHELQYAKMEASGILHYFKKIILSEDYGIMKPDSEIFHQALLVTHSKKENSVMIGDNWDVDILGAKGVGLSQIFYNVYAVDVLGLKDSADTFCVDTLHDIRFLL